MHFLLDGGALIGLQASTEHITVGTLAVSPGAVSTIHAHGGDEVLSAWPEALHVRAWFADETYVFELGPEDAVLLPQGARHEYRNYGGATAEALFGVAPAYLPRRSEGLTPRRCTLMPRQVLSPGGSLMPDL